MIPARRPDQSLAAHQQEVADWIGHGNVVRMNNEHDLLHEALCKWLGIRSHSLAQRDGEPSHGEVAGIEESAVLHVQRLMACHGVGVPE